MCMKTEMSIQSTLYVCISVIMQPIFPDLAYLETNISVTVSGSTAVVCVETEGATTIKLILRDAREQRYTRESEIHCLVN